jgi:hypothetical protein
LIDAKHYSLAHHLIITKIAPLRIISDDFTFIKQLLEAIPGNMVKNWKYGGEFLLEYISVTMSKNPKNASTKKTIKSLLETLSVDLYSRFKDLDDSYIEKCTFHMATKLLSLYQDVEKVCICLIQVDSGKFCSFNVDFDHRSQFCRNDAMDLLFA